MSESTGSSNTRYTGKSKRNLQSNNLNSGEEDSIEAAEAYIQKLEAKVEKLRRRKKKLMEDQNGGVNLEIFINGNAVDVVLTTGLNYQFMFTETVRILHEEGAQVVSANFTVMDQTIFHNIKSQVNEGEAGRISERLRQFVDGIN